MSTRSTLRKVVLAFRDENGVSDITKSNRNDHAHMRDAVLFDGPDRSRRLSRFWILLTLSAVIAAAGVVADSTATVIGAMIVAPMMLPIQGVMLSTVLADRLNLTRSISLVVFGAAAAVGIGFLVGLLVTNDIVAATNSQVAGRVNPKLIDLLAALGTGVVGSIALVRRDISDTLPGVAIAISLVPPLAVAGLTLESGAYTEFFGAMLLFVTNVAAILATGIVVMAVYRIHQPHDPNATSEARSKKRRSAILTVTAMVVIVGVPLTLSSINNTRSTVQESTIQTAAEQWTDEADWDLLSISSNLTGVIVRVTGAMPLPEAERFAEILTENGIDPETVEVDFVPSYKVQLE